MKDINNRKNIDSKETINKSNEKVVSKINSEEGDDLKRRINKSGENNVQERKIDRGPNINKINNKCDDKNVDLQCQVNLETEIMNMEISPKLNNKEISEDLYLKGDSEIDLDGDIDNEYENNSSYIENKETYINEISKNVSKSDSKIRKLRDSNEDNIVNYPLKNPLNMREAFHDESKCKSDIMDENELIRIKYRKKTNTIIPRSTDKYGFITTEEKTSSDSLEFFCCPKKTERRGVKWHNLISEIKSKRLIEEKKNDDKTVLFYIINNKKAKSLVFKGIPLFMKYKLWKLFLNEKKIKLKEKRTKEIRDKDLSTKFNYKIIISSKKNQKDYIKNAFENKSKLSVETSENQFINAANAIHNICSYEHQIHVDVQRTFRRHSLFYEEFGPGQTRLFNVLVLFAKIHPEIGYCQGMSSFVALILMYFPEDEAIKLLLDIFYINSNLFGLFDKELSGIGPVLHCQAMMIKRFLPNVFDHLTKNNIDLSSFVFSWYLTLFTRFEISLVVRIWDLFIFFDFSVLPLIGVALMRYLRDKILKLNGEEILHFLGNIETHYYDNEKIISHVREYMGCLDMDKLRKELNVGW